MPKQIEACIKCGNTSHNENDRFCKNCGSPVINYCNGYNHGCGQVAPPDALYCPNCGRSTLFKDYELIK